MSPVTHTPPPEHLLWCDLESTDSDPHLPHAAILEVGMIITDSTPQLNEIGRASLVIRPPGMQLDHDAIWGQMPQVVRDMHTANGLWREATLGDDAWNLHDVDRELAAWIFRQVGDERVPLAGSGVGHLDKPFIDAFLPTVAARLTYWSLDIGVIRRALDFAGRGDHVNLERDVDAKPHRGLEDCEMHLAEGRRYLALLGTVAEPELADDDGVLNSSGMTSLESTGAGPEAVEVG